MTVTHHIYACSREEPAKRVLMYQGGDGVLQKVMHCWSLFRYHDDVPGYYRDQFDGLWWIKTYAGQQATHNSKESTK